MNSLIFSTYLWCFLQIKVLVFTFQSGCLWFPSFLLFLSFLFLSLLYFLFFFLFIFLTFLYRNSSTILNRRGESWQPCLVPNLRETRQFSIIKYDISCRFFHKCPLFRYRSSIPSLLKVSVTNAYWIFSKFFLCIYCHNIYTYR